MKSLIQRYKAPIRSAIPISSEALLIAMGLSIYLITCLVLRLPLSSPLALLPPFFASILLEGWEIIDVYGLEGLIASPPSKLMSILLRHSRDVLLFNLGPILIYGAAYWISR